MEILHRLLFSQTDQICGHNDLIRAINRLPEYNRQVIALHYKDGISRKDIARRLGWSESKVNTKITRGISLLKRELNPAAFHKANELWRIKQEKLGVQLNPFFRT